MTTAKWSGRKVTSARSYWLVRLPLGCAICGKPVTRDMRWVVEHVIPRSQGGSVTDRSNQWVSHRSPCSDRSGARMGAAITNARKPKAVVRLDTNKARGLRGI